MPVQIPLPSDVARAELQVVLGDVYKADGVRFEDGVSYTLRIDWNGRAACWTLGIKDADGADLLRGKALRLGSLRLRRHGRASGLPAGDLLLVDLTGAGEDPGLATLARDFALLYYTSGELAAAGL